MCPLFVIRWYCTHFRHPTDEQLQHRYIFKQLLSLPVCPLWIIYCNILGYCYKGHKKKFSNCHDEPSFLLVDISTSFGENLYANVSLLRNRKFDLISQSGWITLHATISCELDFLLARSWTAIALLGFCTFVFEHFFGAFRSKSQMK